MSINVNLSDFSVINTNVKLLHSDDGENFIMKTIKPNIDFGLTILDINEWIKEYVEILINSKIHFPKIIDFNIFDDCIVYFCEYSGRNVIETYPDLSDLLNEEKILNDILEIINIAVESKIWIDPHPKNFVIKEGIVSFVDFTPPYQIKKYRQARIKLENKDNKRDYIKKNLRVFKPKNLFYHFIGDFLKITNDRVFIEEIYNLVKSNNFVSLPFEEGILKAKSIRSIENRRDELGIYLF